MRRYQEGKAAKFLYSRYANPTVVVTEQKLAALDRAEAALVFASGMAASSTILLTLLRPGDELVCSAAIYGGTFHLMHDVLAQFGVSVRFVTLEELADPARVDRRADAPVLVRVADQPDAALRGRPRRSRGACRARGVLSVLDNTFASPINQQPLALGVDLAMQSATKYLNGHCDVTGGVVSGPQALMTQDRPDAALPGRRHGSAGGLRAGARPEDAARAHRARTTPTRWRSRAFLEARLARDRACSTRGWRRIPTTRSRARR